MSRKDDEKKKMFDDWKGYSVIQVAKIAGVDRSTVYRWVNGDPNRGIGPSKILYFKRYKNRNKNYLEGKALNKYFEME